MSRATVVELVGLPGAGKSTLATELAAVVPGLVRADRTTAPDVPAPVRLARKGFATAGTLLRSPALSAGLLTDLTATQGAGTAAGRWVHWQQTQALLRRAAAGRDGVRLLDEGALQCLWSAGLRGDVAPLLRRLEAAPAAWAVADLVVVLDVPVPVVADRLAGRTSLHSRTQLLDARDRRAELEHGQELVERLVTWYRSLDGRVVRIDGTGPAYDAARAVASRL